MRSLCELAVWERVGRGHVIDVGLPGRGLLLDRVDRLYDVNPYEFDKTTLKIPLLS